MNSARRLEFGKPCYAVQLKLTTGLWSALQSARQAGESVTMNVGDSNVITVGKQEYPFIAHEAKLQELVRVPQDSNEPCKEVAQIAQRCHVQRTLTEAERERVRLRSIEAENQRRGRTAQVLQHAPKPGRVRKVVSKTVLKSAPKSNPQPKKVQQLRQAPPTRPSPPVQMGSSTPTPITKSPAQAPRAPIQAAAQLNVPKPRSQSLSKLGKAKRSTPAPSGLLPSAPQLAVDVAVKYPQSVAKVIMACIGTGRMKKQRLEQLLADVTARAPNFKFTKGEMESSLKEVADFKAPGAYVLEEYVKKRHLPALQEEFSSATGRQPASLIHSVEDRQPQHNFARTPTPPPFPAGDRAGPQWDWKGLAGDSTAAAGPKGDNGSASKVNGDVKRRNKQPADQPVKGRADTHTHPTTLDNQETHQPKESAARAGVAKVEKKRKATASPEEEHPPPLKQRAATAPAEQTKPVPTQNVTSTKLKDILAAEGITSSGAEADSSWYEGFIREPQLGRGVPDGVHRFAALCSEHDKMYGTYVRLGKRLNSFKRSYTALHAAADAAEADNRQGDLEAQIKLYYDSRIGRVRQMDVAFKTLHEELKDIKRVLGSFCEARE